MTGKTFVHIREVLMWFIPRRPGARRPSWLRGARAAPTSAPHTREHFLTRLLCAFWRFFPNPQGKSQEQVASLEGIPVAGSLYKQGDPFPECSASSPQAAPHPPHLTLLLLKADDEQLKVYWNLFQLFLPQPRTQLGNPELLLEVKRCFTSTETG